MAIRWIRDWWESLRHRYWNGVEAECERDENCRFMRNALCAIAQEYQQMPYESLLQSVEEVSASRTINGITLHFSTEVEHVEPIGDIHVCIDVSGLATQTWWKPSYRFVKRRDGSVYY